ncbi:LysR family transcriptional regulator [Aquincola sp. S2]|uniref:LysR family transcriptional regulator n=1 Tax=Pseudaquabacterium terrae TaxID=2732868 RepID=A0ABX2EG61_9BURK|nr:LysR substrate-binding domain-containing protein [Aquabacterium terrae]NRF67599.1 LysR family transcriptional regulator [Aquabacterium terrae]
MPRKIPSLQALSCFDAAARHESYTRAAHELALTQGAVSRQIAALEGTLGVALFRRTRHGVALTPAGAAYARQVAGRLDGLERDTLDAMAQHSGSGGAIHLAAVPTFATRWLLPRLPDLAAKHPDITVHVEVATRPFLFADSGHDVALYAGTPQQVANWAGTQATLLLHEEVLPVASPALLAGRKRWAPAELATLPLLQQSTRPEGWRDWFAAMDAAEIAASPRALQGPRYELFSMLAVAAAQGLGLALVPRLLVEAELARGELRIACPRPLRGQRGYYVVMPEDDGAQRPALATFRDWLLAQAGAAPTGVAPAPQQRSGVRR